MMLQDDVTLGLEIKVSAKALDLTLQTMCQYLNNEENSFFIWHLKCKIST